MEALLISIVAKTTLVIINTIFKQNGKWFGLVKNDCSYNYANMLLLTI